MTSGAPNYLAIRPQWLALGHEPAIEPALPIIDAHHHLWQRPGWSYGVADLGADIADSGHNVIATVYMQGLHAYRTSGPVALRPVGETEFARDAAAGCTGGPLLCAGIVAHADLGLGAAVEEVCLAHLEAGRGRFRGIRHVTAWNPDASMANPLSACPPGLLADAAFRSGFARLRPLGLSFDAWLFHPQIPELTALARAFPDTDIILDHLGGILGIGAYAGRRDEIFARWSADIGSLATCNNVSLKLGGLGMRINGFGFDGEAVPPSSERLAAAWSPYVNVCLETFGPDRCMIQSNFPVDKGSYPYGTLWNAFKRMTASLPADDRTELFTGTAKRVYRV